MISVVQDIICSSESDWQQTIDTLFDMFPNTNRVEEIRRRDKFTLEDSSVMEQVSLI